MQYRYNSQATGILSKLV